MKPGVAILLLSSLLLFLFTYTGVSKLSDPAGFRAVLLRMPLIARGAAALAVAVPSAELVIALLLLFPATRLKGLWASVALLSVFTVFLVYMLLFLPHLPCSCGGLIGRFSWKGHLALNLGLVGLTVTAIRKMKGEAVGSQQ